MRNRGRERRARAHDDRPENELNGNQREQQDCRRARTLFAPDRRKRRARAGGA